MKKIKKSKKSKLSTRNLVIGIFFLSAVAYFAISRLPKPVAEPIGINEVSSISPSVTLSLPATIKATLGSESSADITINTGSTSISAAQIELKYDPSAISGVTVVKGDFLGVELSKPKISQGTIAFTYAVAPEAGAKSGSGKLAAIKFKVLKDNSQISFASNTMVAAIGLDINALKSATSTTIQASENVSAATPPALANIAARPTAAPAKAAAKSAAVNSVAETSPSYGEQAASPSFLPEQDFDYADTPTLDVQSELPIKSSAFTRFLNWIKLIFGAKNAEN